MLIFVGFRIGAGFGPFSVSTRIGGGGGGGGDGDGFDLLLFVVGVLVLSGPIIWISELDWENLKDNLFYWVIFNLLPMVLLWVLGLKLLSLFSNSYSLMTWAVISFPTPLVFFYFMHEIPLVDRKLEHLSGPEKQKLYGSSMADFAPIHY